MNHTVAALLIAMREHDSRREIDAVLRAFEELRRISTPQDVPALVAAMHKEESNFWLRELLSEPICQLGGSACLPALLDGLEKGELEGHDNDGFCFHLTELAGTEPVACRAILEAITALPVHKHKQRAEWLLEFCVENNT